MFQKKKIILFQICLFLFVETNIIHAQNFKPFRVLRTIQTKYFTIIFPAESELSAFTLAGFADEVYDEIHALLKIDLSKKIPVVLTPDTDQFNGYTSSMPYPRIVLFDAPMNLEWTSYENALRSLFLHELTHAFSLSSRSPAYETLYRIFGGWVSPALLIAPLFMVEGVTVSFESLSGFGRANDPLIKQEIRQAIHEQKTLTPFQLSGVYDLPPSQGAYYEYGGLFSAYLQKKYGMEKYAELWQEMGWDYNFSFRIYHSGFYYLFNKVYDIPFPEAWTDFQNSLALNNIVENPHSILFSSTPPFAPARPVINVLASSNDTIYFGSQLDRELLRYNPQSKEIEKVMNMDSSVFDIALSPHGETLLLSSFRYKENLASAVVTEYETSHGRATGRKWEHIARGQYFRDGIIGLTSNLHNTNIVYRTSSGKEEVLLYGNEERIFTTPHTVNETWIVYVRSVKGVRELCMFNYETKKEYMLKSNLEDDLPRWKYIRNLRVSQGKILFSYNHDDRMYKLGIIDISSFYGEDSVMNAVFHSVDFSGGVFLPSLLRDGNIFYRGFFSHEDKLMRFPETLNTLSGTKAEIKLIPDDQNISADFFAAQRTHTFQKNFTSKKYFGLAYMNPFEFWIPFLTLIRPTESFISLDGLGFISIMMDPTDTNMITVSAIGDWKAKMVNAAINWNNYYFGFPITLSFADGVDLMYGSDSYRKTQASLSGTLTRSLANERNRISVVGAFHFSISADNPFNNSSAYFWDYDEPVFSGVLGAAWSNLYRYAWQLFGTGLNLSFYYRTPFDFSKTRLDGTIDIAFEKIFPFRFQFYGAWDTGGMNIQGNNRSYSSYFSNLASVEYPSPNGLNVEWIAGGQAELALFKFEIQKNLSHFYFNRIYSTLAYRAVLYDGKEIPMVEGTPVHQNILLAQSLILRLGFESSIIPLKSAPIKIIPSIWGAWKISNMNDGKTNDFYFNFGFEITL